MGKDITGKPLISILRSGHSSTTPLNDIVSSTRSDGLVPKELAAVVANKYRFVVQVTSKSFESESVRPSYQVHRIDTTFGKQLHSSALRKPAPLSGSSAKSPTSQVPLMLGSSSGPYSPTDNIVALDAPPALSDTDVSYTYL